MKTAASALMAAWLVLLPAPSAWAGQAHCWLDQGVVVVPASVAGIAGDYILDTGSAQTQLHETRAQGAGISAGALIAEVRVAGRRFGARPVVVADLDARTAAFPTPIAGVLGADLLEGQILDLAFRPCRLRLHEPRRASRFGGGASLPLHKVGGRLAAPAVATDGARLLAGDFVLATGLGAGLALDPELAADADAGAAARPRRMRALSFAGDLQENLSAQVIADPDGGAALGVRALMGYRLRFDVAHGRLRLAPAQQKGPSDHPDGP